MSVLDCIVGQPLWIWKDTIGKPHTCAVISGSATYSDIFTDRHAIYFAAAGSSVLRFTPLGAGSAVDLTVTAHDPLGAVATKSLVNVGDSGTTDTGYPKLLKDNMGSLLTLLGTQGTTFVHEGYGGRTWDWISNHTDSPMTSATDTLDIAAFETALGAVPDFYTFSFGSNDCFSLTNDGVSQATIDSTIAATIGYARDVVAAVRAENATAKIGLSYTFPGSLLETTWKTAYPNPTYADPLRTDNWVPIIRQYWQAMKTEFAGEEGSNVFLISTQSTMNTGPTSQFGAYPDNDPFHHVIGLNVAGHSENAKTIEAWLTAEW